MNVGIVRLNVVNTVIEPRTWPARVSAANNTKSKSQYDGETHRDDHQQDGVIQAFGYQRPDWNVIDVGCPEASSGDSGYPVRVLRSQREVQAECFGDRIDPCRGRVEPCKYDGRVPWREPQEPEDHDGREPQRDDRRK